MKLLILGKNKDDKGTQLEQLAIKILRSQGYVDIIPNMQVSGASELDVTAQKSNQTGIKDIRTPVICECKAHESPINMTDWLKFIGKLAIERKKNPNAIGLMIALSGANGSVMGSYQTDFLNDSTLQLIANDDIIKLLSNFNILSNEKEVETIVNNLNIGRIAEISLVYYEHQIWWLVGFIDGKFTFLNSSTKFVPESEISEVLSILPNYTTYQSTNYVDVIHTIEFVQQAKQIELLILNNVLCNNGNVRLVDIAKRIKNIQTNETINEDWLTDIIDKSAFLQVNEGQVCLCDINEIDIPSFYRFVISNETPIDLFSSEFYQRHIDNDLLNQVWAIQFGFILPEKYWEDCKKIFKLSPSALLYALNPDPIYRNSNIPGLSESMRDLYIQHFMDSIMSKFYIDFQHGAFSNMYYNKMGLRQLCKENTIVLSFKDKDDIRLSTKQLLEIIELKDCHTSCIVNKIIENDKINNNK